MSFNLLATQINNNSSLTVNLKPIQLNTCGDMCNDRMGVCAGRQWWINKGAGGVLVRLFHWLD